MKVKSLVLILGFMSVFSVYSDVINVEHALEKIRKIERSRVYDFVKTHKIYFIHAGFCPMCHAISPMVRSFVDRFDLDVEAITVDGDLLKEFPEATQEFSYVRKFKILRLPALVVASKSSDEVVGLKYGLVPEGNIIDWFADVINNFNFMKENL